MKNSQNRVKENGHILIIGGTGFVGKHLVRHFLEKSFTVFSLARNQEIHGRENLIPIEGNMNNAVLLRPILQKCATIIHAAGDSVPGDSIHAPMSEVYNNLIPSASLIETLQEFERKHIVYISSGGAIYGNPTILPASENSPFAPLSYHGAFKASVETCLHALTAQTSHKATILRPSNLYGPGQRNKKNFGLIQAALNCIRDDSEITIWGDGSTVKDYLYIDDFVDACEKAVFNPPKERIAAYNAGSAIGYSVLEICAMIEQITHRQINKTYKQDRLIDPSVIILNNEKIRKDLGWEPKVGLREGIEALWNAHYRD